MKTVKIMTNKKNRTKKRQSSNEKIAYRIKPITFEQAQNDFHSLQKMSCTMVRNASGRKVLGNNVVDYFTFEERLHTKGHQNVSFYDFWKNRKVYIKKPYVKKMLKFYETRNIDEIRKYKYIYNLYFSSIAVFRPIMAMDVYCRVHAKRVLDFTMGWGGRLIGACALNLEAYYGIDLNKHLEGPYQKMREMMSTTENVDTHIELYFKDALDIDYSQFDYDTVLTSPPYYDIEKYRNSSNKYKNQSEWNDQFYGPLFKKTFESLKKGGNYCLNIPVELYENCARITLGDCSQKMLLKKSDRHIGKYKEYIYIWEK